MKSSVKFSLGSFLILFFALGFTRGTPSQSTHVLGDLLLTLEQEASASIVELGPHYKSDRVFLSKVYEAEYPFQLLGLNWEQLLPEDTGMTMEISFQNREGEWSEWQPIRKDEDHPSHDGIKDEEGLWTYFITDESSAFQYRAFLSTQDSSVTPKLMNVSFDYVNGGQPSAISKIETALKRLVFQKDQELLTRSEWGADEDLRLAKNYDVELSSQWESELSEEEVEEDPDMEIIKTIKIDENGDRLLWPQEYPAEVKKIILHHTATTKDLDDPETAIRAIYYYHSVTRGWGDIGYNFIVDQEGTVYEGRAGGEGVVGGHASGYNTGSVGIALLGNYEDTPIPGEMMQGFFALIYDEADLYDIDPDAYSLFRGESIPNILGHKDVEATSCPGDYPYDYLDDIRNVVGNALDARRNKSTDTDFAYQEIGIRELLPLSPLEEVGISIKIKNTGTETWDENTYLVLNANSEADQMVTVPKDSQTRTAQMQEESVEPGDTATFTFKVSATMNGGLAHFDVSPIFNGEEKTAHYMDLALYVEQPSLDFEVVEEDAPSAMKPGESAIVNIKLKNIGNVTWEKEGENAVTLVQSGSSKLVSESTLASLEEEQVEVGEIGTFTFELKAPTEGGTYTVYYRPEMENSNAVLPSSGQIRVEVMDSEEDAVVIDSVENLSFKPGETKFLWIQVKNTSLLHWLPSGEDAFSLAFTEPQGLTVGEPRISFKSLGVGASTKVYFEVTASDEPGDYTLELRPRLGSTNLTTEAYDLTITVIEEEFTPPDYENPIRIKLTPDSAIGTPILSSKSLFAVYNDEELIKVFPENSRVRVTPGEDEFTLTSGTWREVVDGPVRFVPMEGGIMKILTMEQGASWDSTINDNQFRGSIEVEEVDGEAILINELPLEDYLKGIAENSSSDPEEKIKTILILARSYAYYYMTKDEKFEGMPYHLEDDPDTSQKYLGYGFESRSPEVISAVEETKGVVVTYQGEVVKTPYFSKSDGVATKSAEEVWGWTDTPWLKSVPDPYCDSEDFYGHGVGLSACGAKALAKQGWTFEEIIQYYYTGVELSTL